MGIPLTPKEQSTLINIDNDISKVEQEIKDYNNGIIKKSPNITKIIHKIEKNYVLLNVYKNYKNYQNSNRILLMNLLNQIGDINETLTRFLDPFYRKPDLEISYNSKVSILNNTIKTGTYVNGRQFINNTSKDNADIFYIYKGSGYDKIEVPRTLSGTNDILVLNAFIDFQTNYKNVEKVRIAILSKIATSDLINKSVLDIIKSIKQNINILEDSLSTEKKKKIDIFVSKLEKLKIQRMGIVN